MISYSSTSPLFLLVILFISLWNHYYHHPSLSLSSWTIDFCFVATAAAAAASSTTSSLTNRRNNPTSHFKKTSSSLSSLSSSSSTSSSCIIPPSGGLLNLGNTCYLNAQLQCVYHIPYIRELIIHLTNTSYDSNKTRRMNSITPALESLGHVFTSMKKKSYIQRQEEEETIHSTSSSSSSSRSNSVSTETLCKTLGIHIYEQQDSQEFWKLLLPELHLSSLMDLYQGSYETFIVSLDGSGRERKQKEIFLDLSLDIHKKSSSRSSHDPSTYHSCVQESLEDLFSHAELLSVQEGNGWKVNKNSTIKIDALKGNTLYSIGLPKILQLHLLRFYFDSQKEEMNKIHDSFEFPMDLDLSSLCRDLTHDDDKDDAMYTLHSIVVHKGEFGSGHYYSYIRPDITKNIWFKYDDDRVSYVSFQQVQEDSFGDSSSLITTTTTRNNSWNPRKGLSQWFQGFTSLIGKQKQDKSSAYVLQYVKKKDIPFLWNV